MTNPLMWFRALKKRRSALRKQPARVNVHPGNDGHWYALVQVSRSSRPRHDRTETAVFPQGIRIPAEQQDTWLKLIGKIRERDRLSVHELRRDIAGGRV